MRARDRPARQVLGRSLPALCWGGVGLVVFVLATLWGSAVGPTHISLGDVVGGIVVGGHGTSALIVRDIRLPRAVLGGLVGIAVSTAGVIGQAVTANDLGAPDILGVNAGAAVAAVAGLTVAPSLARGNLTLVAMAGAFAAGLLVVGLSGVGRARIDPVRLILAGVTVTLLLFSVTQTLIIIASNDTSGIFHWIVGGVNYAVWPQVRTLLPFTAVGFALAMALAGRLNLLALGEDLAAGLGLRVGRVRLFGWALIIVLAGSAVAEAGAFAFVGLVMPHVARRLVGRNHFYVLPVAAILAADVVVLADVVSRFIAPPGEVPSGIVTSLIGAPVFVYLARRQSHAVRSEAPT